MSNRSLIFSFLLLFLCCNGFAQQKHALLIGINDYYCINKDKVIYKLSADYCLTGCVNDALSIKELIVSRFGFEESNITELYDSMATRQNILDSIQSLLAKSDSGDIAFVYYSGHGNTVPVASDGGMNQNDSLEVILPSDVYTTKTYSCIQTSQIAAEFNKFVDKNVTLTAIFDCCFSYGTEGGVPVFAFPASAKKNLTLKDYRRMENPEFDEMNKEDTGLPNSATRIIPSDLAGVKGKSIDPYINDSLWRSIPDSSLQSWGVRKFYNRRIPSKIEGSKFLFLSATTDKQKAVEVKDESGVRRGLFTKLLINVFKKNPSAISGQDVYSCLLNEFKPYSSIKQTPSHSTADLRKWQTVLGVEQEAITSYFVAECTGVSGDTLLFNKGYLAGFAIGNTLKSTNEPALKAEIIETGSFSSKAILTSPGKRLAKAGDWFKVVDWSTRQKPALRVYMPKEVCSSEQLSGIYSQIILPLRKNKNFMPYESAAPSCSKIFMKSDAVSFTFLNGKTNEVTEVKLNAAEEVVKYINNNTENQPFFIYLPVTYGIAATIKADCQKTNVVFYTEDPEDADVSFYCSYYKDLKGADVKKRKTVKSKKSGNAITNVLIAKDEAPSLPLVIAGSNEIVGKNRWSRSHIFNPLETYIKISEDEKKLSEIADFSALTRYWLDKKISGN